MSSFERYETKAGTKWMVRWRDNAKQARKKKGFKTKREAVLWWQDYTAGNPRLSDAPLSTAQRLEVQHLYEGWVDGRKNMAPSTFRKDEGVWRNHVLPYWGPRRVVDIDGVDVSEWLDELKTRLSGSQTNAAKRVLKGVLDVAVPRRIIATNPVLSARTVPMTDEDLEAAEGAALQILESGQVKLLMDSIDDPARVGYALLVRTLAVAGLRWGEAVALSPDAVHITEDGSYLRIYRAWRGGDGQDKGRHLARTKTKQSRSVAIPTPLARDLLEQGKGQQWLWEAPQNPGTALDRPSGTSNWWRAAVAAAHKADPDFPERMKLHNLRHTCASRLISAGVPIPAVSAHLGHAKVSRTLDTYAHLMRPDQSQIRGALTRLDEGTEKGTIL